MKEVSLRPGMNSIFVVSTTNNANFVRALVVLAINKLEWSRDKVIGEFGELIKLKHAIQTIKEAETLKNLLMLVFAASIEIFITNYLNLNKEISNNIIYFIIYNLTSI